MTGWSMVRVLAVALMGAAALTLLSAQVPAQTGEAGRPAAELGAVPPPVVDPCEVPGYLLFGDSRLDHVNKSVSQNKRLTILVLGSASSLMPGPDGVTKAYPGRLEEALRRRFPDVEVKVIALAKARQTAADMAQSVEKVLLERKPDLVIWQTGTVDAMRGVDPESFRAALDDGIDHILEGDADLILMNMQYSPRTETLIALTSYDDIMRVVARDRDVPLFDRREIMRYWNDNGNFDLNLATKDVATAYQVHDCLGRALASLVVEAAGLDSAKQRPTQ